MKKTISQRKARRLQRIVRQIETEAWSLDRVQERRHITTWTGLDTRLVDEVRVLTRAGFRVELIHAGEGKLETYAVRRLDRIRL